MSFATEHLRMNKKQLIERVDYLLSELTTLKRERAEAVLMLQSFIEDINTDLHLADQVKQLGKLFYDAEGERDWLKGENGKGELARLENQPNMFNDEGCQYKCHVVDRLKGEVESLTAGMNELYVKYVETDTHNVRLVEHVRGCDTIEQQLKSRLVLLEDVVEVTKGLGEVVAEPHLRYPDWWPDSRIPSVISAIFDALTRLEGRE